MEVVDCYMIQDKDRMKKKMLSCLPVVLGFLLGGVFGTGVGYFRWSITHSPMRTFTLQVDAPKTEKDARTITAVYSESKNDDSRPTKVSSDTTTVVIPPKESEQNTIKVDSAQLYLCKTIEFHQNLITWLYSTIAILLVVGFVYVSSKSYSHAENITRQALKEECFKHDLKMLVQNNIGEFYDEDMESLQSGLEQCQSSVTQLDERLVFVENAVNEDQTSLENPQQEDNNGDN
jgi:hypothetical protein